MLISVAACMDAPVKEYFCESTDNGGGVNFYKQQIVRLNEKQMCLLWPSDALICLSANQTMSTPWQVDEDKGIKHQESLNLRINRESALVEIMQKQSPLTSETADEKPLSPLLRYEFKKRAEVLTLLTSAVDKDPRVFACKPWVKRPWWSLY